MRALDLFFTIGVKHTQIAQVNIEMKSKNQFNNEKYYIDKPYKTMVVYRKGYEEWMLKYLAQDPQLDISYVRE